VLETQTLRDMYLENDRIFVTQRDDPAPKGMASNDSCRSAVMGARVERVLIRKGDYPGVEMETEEYKPREAAKRESSS
jgi:hypothetical protein